MGYLGNEPTSNFASVTKDLFSGDGSTVAFTLSKASTTNGVAVFVENVRQEPTIAYAVSGTTLTFTAAPVTSSGNNIYVLHHNAPASTATHPAAQPLTATSGTFTGDLLLSSDSAAIKFGADSEITLTHSADDGLVLKHVGTSDGKEPSLTFQAGDTDIAVDDVLGSIFFQAPDEGAGTDAILVAAGIEAVSEGDFSASANNTSLVFKTGYSEAASEKMRIMSGGAVAVGIQSLGDTHNLAAIGASNDEGVVVRGSNGGCINVVNSSNSDDDFLGQIGFCNLANADAGATDADGQTTAFIRARTITSDSNAQDDSGAYLQLVACAEGATVAEVGRLDPSITRFVGATTSTGNSANCQVDGNGRLHTSTSSKIYKTAIEDLEDEYADKIFSLEPKFYKSNPETVGDDTTKIKPDWSYYGLLAEDVEKIEPRLVTYKLTEEKQVDSGSKGEQGETMYKTVTSNLDTPVPMNVNYDRITAHLINVVKRFKTRIETLEAKVKALEDA
jgi:hypothetical protein